jgi:hypothetical protein
VWADWPVHEIAVVANKYEMTISLSIVDVATPIDAFCNEEVSDGVFDRPSGGQR